MYLEQHILSSISGLINRYFLATYDVTGILIAIWWPNQEKTNFISEIL